VALRDVPVIILSARAGRESAVEGLAAGADDYLVKPFTEQELLARVQANLSLSAMRAELARARAEARMAGERTAFLNTAAHELRTPLTVVGGYLDLLLDGTLDWHSDDAREALARIAHKTREGVQLVEQMLVAARIESSTSSLRRSVQDLRQLVRESVARASSLARLESKTVVALLPPAPVMVDADGALIGIVLDSLMVSALYHGGRTIQVNVEAEPPVVSVADVVAEADAGLSFELCRRVAELHGGTLRLENRDEGATFALTLPAAGAAAARDVAAVAADRAG
jgi:signal transduction histidine kinase